MVKNNKNRLCKNNVEKSTRYWTGCYYLVSNRKSTVPVYRSIMDIVLNYNALKVLYFLFIDNTGITKDDIPYISKYLDQFDNFYICPVACPLVMYKLFGFVNEVNYQKKSRKSNLVLEKYWVNNCGCLQWM